VQDVFVGAAHDPIGILRPPEESAAAAPAASRKGNDGALLFRPVPDSGDGVIRDLVGNVAEFLDDAPDAFADLASGTADEIKVLIDQ